MTPKQAYNQIVGNIGDSESQRWKTGFALHWKIWLEQRMAADWSDNERRLFNEVAAQIDELPKADLEFLEQFKAKPLHLMEF